MSLGGKSFATKWHPTLRVKFALSIMLMGVLLAASTLSATYYITRKNNLERYRQNVAATVQMAATFVDGDKIEEYLTGGRDMDSYLSTSEDGIAYPLFDADEYYVDTMTKLIDMRRYYNMTYIYVYDPRMDDQFTADYVFDVSADSATGGEPGELVGYRYEFDIEALASDTSLPLIRRIYETGEANLELNLTRSENGYLASAFMPVFNSSGKIVAVIGADVEVSQVYADLRSMLTILFLIIIAIVAVAILLFSRYVNGNMIRPIQLLVDSAANFVHNHYGGGKGSSTPIVINTRDEMQKLAEAFNTMTEDITQYIREVTQLTNEKERIAAELSVAKKIQESALPRDFDISPVPGLFSLYGTMEPAKEVGGDFYDFFLLPGDNKLCFLIGDVSGKGVPAALFMMMAKSIIRDNMLRGASMTEAFVSANNQLCANNEEGMFVTVLCLLLDLETGDVQIVDAGHGLPMRVSEGGALEQIPTKRGFVMGGMEGMRYRMAENKLEPGDTIFLFTDGVSEADNPKKELFGTDRIEKSLMEHRSRDLTDMLAGIRGDVSVFADGADQADDITMLALLYKPRKENSNV